MLTLYFSPGACSMASHIGLEETGAPYEEKPVLLPKGEHKTDAYLKINPRGKVPALSVDGKVITENTAILTYLAKRFPDKNLLPADPVEEARCISTMAWFSNSVHPPYTHYLRPERYADGEAAQAAVKVTAKQTFLAQCSEIDSLLENKQWIMGDQYTVADPYALVFYGWGVRAGFPMTELSAYTAWKDRMLKRPTVKKILESEQNVLIKPA
ncbi:MAG: glutathione S-transferase family protein [Burkholderiales bacterium]